MEGEMLILTLETHAPKGHIHIYDERMSFPVHSHRTRNNKFNKNTSSLLLLKQKLFTINLILL